MQKKRDCHLIYTGGTIGMRNSQQGLTPAADSIAQYLKLQNWHHQITLESAAQLIDSSALSFSHWNNYLDLIYAHLESNTGVVLLHGTDTLAYTAAMLSLLFSNPPAPIIVTGSNWPLADSHSDAPTNLFSDIIAAQTLPAAVYVVFNGRLLLASDCVKVSSQHPDAFMTPHCIDLGRYNARSECWNYIKLPNLLSNRQETVSEKFRFNTSVRVLNFFLVPGGGDDLADLLMANIAWDGIIIQSMGDGNFPLSLTVKKALSFFLQQNKPVLNVSQTLDARVKKIYRANQDIAGCGVLNTDRLSFAFCYAALITALSTAPQQSIALLKQWIKVRNIYYQTINKLVLDVSSA